LAGSLALLPTMASAQPEVFSLDDFLSEPRHHAIDEIATDLAYGFCPLYLANQFPLSGNVELSQRGFGADIARTPDARFGEMEQVFAIRPDGNVGFGGVPGLVCSVTVTGADLDAVLARWHSDMSFMGFAFQLDPAQSGERGTATVETYKAPIEGQVLNLQLARLSAPQPAVVAQLYGTAE
jgi:hypothetical protein